MTYGIDSRYMSRYDEKVLSLLRKIKESGGFPGEVSDELFKLVNGYYTTVELSPYTGLRLQWHLTKNGREALRWDNYKKRHAERNKIEAEKRERRRQPDPVAPIPLTVEFRDALKSILNTGDPNTDKLDILARIQRQGGGGYYLGEYVADGPFALFKNGIWTLTNRGKEIAAAHIRKDQCAQFTGKVR